MSAYCSICEAYTVTAEESEGTVCTICGTILQGLSFSEDVSFGENHLGAATLIGSVVTDNGNSVLRGLAGASVESRQITIAKASRRLHSMANQIQAPTHISDHALNVYKLALTHNFTKGRKQDHVAAACLYIACRLKKTSHMLLDFSEILKEDVFVLGSCFVQLSRTLKIDLPVVEPYFYVRRFCSHLEFEDKYNDVVKTALQFVSCLKRDWIQTGRRPAGVCAAAILISARIHGFRRSQKEVTHVARICAATLSKRLKEFEDTPASSMTVEEFQEHAQKIQNETYQGPECDPPAFTRGQNKEKQLEEIRKIHEIAERDRQDYLRRRGEQEAEVRASTNRKEQTDVVSYYKDELTKLAKQDAFKQIDNVYENPDNAPSTVTDEPTEEEAIVGYTDEQPEIIDEGNLDELDDAELLEFIITDKNVIANREALWDEMNGEYVREMEQKKRERELRALEEGDKPKRKRKRKDPNAEPEKPAQSAAEAAASLRKKGYIAIRSGFDVDNLFDMSGFNADNFGTDNFDEYTHTMLETDLGTDLPDEVDEETERVYKRNKYM